MEQYSLSDLAIFIGACSAALAGVLAAIFRSKCTHVKLCCCECNRPLEAILKDLPPRKAQQGEAQP